jgi:hypothetical protein
MHKSIFQSRHYTDFYSYFVFFVNLLNHLHFHILSRKKTPVLYVDFSSCRLSMADESICSPMVIAIVIVATSVRIVPTKFALSLGQEDGCSWSHSCKPFSFHWILNSYEYYMQHSDLMLFATDYGLALSDTTEDANRRIFETFCSSEKFKEAVEVRMCVYCEVRTWSTKISKAVPITGPGGPYMCFL